MWPIPRSVEEALRLWDEGKEICSIETGGLGPSHEQAIQVLVIEIVRAYRGKLLPTIAEEWREWANDIVRKHAVALGGIDEEQEYVAKNLAFNIIAHDWPNALELYASTRKIIIRNFWPRATTEWEQGEEAVVDENG